MAKYKWYLIANTTFVKFIGEEYSSYQWEPNEWQKVPHNLNDYMYDRISLNFNIAAFTKYFDENQPAIKEFLEDI